MEFTYKTKQLVKISKEVGNFYDIEKSAYNDDIEALNKMYQILADIDEETAYNEIDRRLEEGAKISNLYDEIFDGINSKGFFKEKLKTDMKSLPLDVTRVTQELYEKYLNQEMEQAIADARTLKNI